VEVVLPPEVYLESARVTHFNPEDQAEDRELDANLLEEMRNTTLSNMHKYQTTLKKYYNKSVVQRELHIGDLVLKKDIRTKDKHKFSTPWEGSFIIVDVVALGAFVLVEN
jgi:spermidine/putrescine-binding protein